MLDFSGWGLATMNYLREEYVNYIRFFVSAAYFEVCPSMLDFSGWGLSTNNCLRAEHVNYM